MVILDLKSYEDFVSTVPAAGSVETKEQCIALLNSWVAYGPTEALLETAHALSPVHYPALRGQLLYLWEGWCLGGEGTRKGVRAKVKRIL